MNKSSGHKFKRCKKKLKKNTQKLVKALTQIWQFKEHKKINRELRLDKIFLEKKDFQTHPNIFFLNRQTLKCSKKNLPFLTENPSIFHQKFLRVSTSSSHTSRLIHKSRRQMTEEGQNIRIFQVSSESFIQTTLCSRPSILSIATS